MKQRITLIIAISLAMTSQLVSAGSISDVYNTDDILTTTLNNVKSAVNNNDTRISTNTNNGVAHSGSISSHHLPVFAWANNDLNTSGTTITVKTQINSIAINAPAAGFLIISGTVFVNHQNVLAQSIYLDVTLDGATALPTRASAFRATNNANDNNDIGSMAYTVMIPVTAGAHTIGQDLTVVAPTFYNRNYLTVQFIPAAQGVITTIPLAEVIINNSLDANGNIK